MLKFQYFLDKKFNDEVDFVKSLELKRMAMNGQSIKQFMNKDQTSVYVGFRVQGKYFKVRTTEKIFPIHWDQKSQKVRSSHPLSFEINLNLSTLKLDIERRYRNLILDLKSESIITADQIQQLIKDIIERKQPIAKTKDFFNAYEEFLVVKKIFSKPNTLKRYGTLKAHLIKFEKENSKIKFENINEQFLERFVAHLLSIEKKFKTEKDKHLKNNSIAKIIACTKAFLRWAMDNNYVIDPKVLKYKLKYDATDIVYLTKDEFMKILDMDLGADKVLSEVRDTFCFQTLTGQRYSDIKSLHWGNIINKPDGLVWECWQRKQNKSEKVSIPISDRALEILNRYPNRMANMKDKDGNPVHQTVLPVRCDQVMNRHLKTLAQMAGLEEIIIQVKYSGTKRVEFAKPKYEMISTHTARRTFVTLGLELGMRPEVVMACTGHTDVRMMRRYLKINDKVKSQEVRNAWKLPSLDKKTE